MRSIAAAIGSRHVASPTRRGGREFRAAVTPRPRERFSKVVDGDAAASRASARWITPRAASHSTLSASTAPVFRARDFDQPMQRGQWRLAGAAGTRSPSAADRRVARRPGRARQPGSSAGVPQPGRGPGPLRRARSRATCGWGLSPAGMPLELVECFESKRPAAGSRTIALRASSAWSDSADSRWLPSRRIAAEETAGSVVPGMQYAQRRVHSAAVARGFESLEHARPRCRGTSSGRVHPAGGGPPAPGRAEPGLRVSGRRGRRRTAAQELRISEAADFESPRGTTSSGASAFASSEHPGDHDADQVQRRSSARPSASASPCRPSA